MKTLTTISLFGILSGTLALGCGDDGILLAELLASSTDSSSEPGAPAEPAPTAGTPTPTGAVSRAEVEQILLDRCGDCHSGGVVAGDLGDIEDIDALIERGIIIPGNPNDSLLIRRIELGTMPPNFVDERVSPEEREHLRTFVADLPRESKALISSTLTRYCSDCHTDDPDTARGFLDRIGDVDALIERGLIVPGDRESSRIYNRMDEGSMPPASILDKRPSSEEIEAVGDAIDAL